MSTPDAPPRDGSRKAAPRAALWFEPLLARIARATTEVVLRKGGVLYAQGQEADSVYFVQQGKVRRSVRSKAGQQAILDVLTPGEFCGEACLAGQMLRVSSATAATAATVVRVDKAVLAKALRGDFALSEAFLAHLLARNLAVEKDLCEQLFSHVERRLACALLKLSRFGQAAAHAGPRAASATVSEAVLAALTGATTLRVKSLLNQFRHLGLVDFGGVVPRGEIRVYPRLLSEVVLSDA